MRHVFARRFAYLLPAGFAVLLAACGSAAPAASSPPQASLTSAAAKPASALAIASPAGAPSAASKPSEPAPVSAAPSAARTGPAAVAQRWVDILNKGDTAGLAALFTDDAVLVGAGPCTLKTPCVGLAGAAKRVQTAVDRHTQQELVVTPAVVGNIVQWSQEVRNDNTKAAGVDR